MTDLDLSGLPQTSCQVYIGDVDGGVPSGAVDPPSYANSQCFLRLLQNNINSHQIFSIFILYIWLSMKLQNFYIWLYSKRNQVFLVHVEMLVEKNHQTQLNLKALLKKNPPNIPETRKYWLTKMCVLAWEMNTLETVTSFSPCWPATLAKGLWFS